ncbi:MAG TPA: hypothetical protein VGD52_01890 [Pseudoduganella sp.]
MSNTQYVFLKQAAIPSRQDLQAAVDALGFDLKLYPELDFAKDSGFSPCTLGGTPDVGFELYSGEAAEFLDGDEDLLELVGDRDFCISMSWRGSMKDCAAAMIVSCALAKLCDAVISYEGYPPEPLSKMLEATNEIVMGARNES